MSKGGGVRSDESGDDGVWCNIKARGELEVRGRKRLDVVVSKKSMEQWRGVGQQNF